MKTLVLSDLHDDFWSDKGRDPFVTCEDIVEGLEAIVLAGDVSNKPKVRWKYAFQRLRDRFGDIPIHVFPGNHDFYDWRLDDEDRLADFAAEFDVSYAQMQSIILGETRLLCATLWTDLALGPGFAANAVHLPTRMNDYRYIRLARGGFRRVFPDDIRRVHARHRGWLEEALAQPFDGPTCVATHHAPHPGVLSKGLDKIEAGYASDLTDILTGPHAPQEWLFGHCHEAVPLTIGSTRLSCISLGYPFEIETDDDIRLRIARGIRHF
jgi:3',5'-cyclic AMP phosphodiesterase CpdA